jgi:multisubunit Na+/H+ antiporter MnhE subunit
MKRVGAAILIGAVYLAATGWGGPMNAAIACIAGFVLARVIPAPRRSGARLDWRRMTRLPWLVAGALVEIARGNMSMLLVLLGRKSRQRVGMLDAPLGDRTERGAVVSAFIATSAPGSIVVGIDERKRTMRVSVIDATRPEELREQLDHFYERYQRGAVP